MNGTFNRQLNPVIDINVSIIMATGVGIAQSV